MKSLSGMWREFTRSMEAAAYAEEGEFETAKSIMRGTDIESLTGKKGAETLALKASGVGR